MGWEAYRPEASADGGRGGPGAGAGAAGWRCSRRELELRHGSAEVNARIPVSGGTWRLHWSGYHSKAATWEAGEALGALLALAGTDATLRAQVGDMIRAARKYALPGVEDLRRRLGLDPGQPGMTTGEWLRTWHDGTPWRPSYVSRRFRQLAEAAGCR